MKVIKYLRPWHVVMVVGPHTSVCTRSPKFVAGGLILTLGIGWQVAQAYVQALQSVSWESGSSLISMIALLLTSL